MKIKINTAIISALKPCQSRLDNWKQVGYESFDGDVQQFLKLPDITAQDTIWVAVRVIPRFLAEVFAIDCAVRAQAHYATAADAAATRAAYAYAAAHADTAAAYDVAADADERQTQVEVLAYLIKAEKSK